MDETPDIEWEIDDEVLNAAEEDESGKKIMDYLLYLNVRFRS